MINHFSLNSLGGHGTIFFERVTFKNYIHFESSHHCEQGSVGGMIFITDSVFGIIFNIKMNS